MKIILIISVQNISKNNNSKERVYVCVNGVPGFDLKNSFIVKSKWFIRKFPIFIRIKKTNLLKTIMLRSCSRQVGQF
jgi:hypothetical protein